MPIRPDSWFGTYPLRTLSQMEALTTATIFFNAEINDTVSEQYLFKMDIALFGLGWKFLVKDNKLYFRAAWNILSGDEGIWSCPFTSTGKFSIAMTYKFNSDESADPSFWVNGVKQTITEEKTPVSLLNLNTYNWYFGGDYPGSNVKCLNGNMGSIAVWNVILTDEQLQGLTSAKMTMAPIMFSSANLLHFWPCDNFYEGEGCSNSVLLYPDSDVDPKWGVSPAGTAHYTAVNGDGSTYIEAGSSSDGLIEKLGLTTTTIPAGATAYAIYVLINGVSDMGDQCTVKLRKGAGTTTETITSSFATSSTLNQFVFFENSWSQSDVDNAEVWLTAPTLDKGDSIRIYNIFAKVYYYNKPIFDLIGTNTLVGLTARGAKGFTSYSDYNYE